MNPELAKYAAATIPMVLTPILLKTGVSQDLCMELIGLYMLALGGHVGRDLIHAHHEGKAKAPKAKP